ncbi:uncharacterized protein atf5b [Chanos chanos]|uniref:Uncharacterized protein atf5b n=1 Tax=Chanos chanos TaxID=29144 RepID=A0A6J2VJ41_CHACN|nr:uncharacterized protein LOC115813628 [Chanos chanos]
MTENFDTFLHPTSTESSPNSSIPPSPLEHDVQVPSELEVMTSLLQEELAQLEDYFLSESTPTKVEKFQKCDKRMQAMATQSYCQLPYTSYNSNQSETNPMLVTLATGELELRSFCGGIISRPKMSRPAPYSYVRSHCNSRRIVTNGFKDGEVFEKDIWNSKETYSGFADVGQCSFSRALGKDSACTKKVRECSMLLKEEETYSFAEDVLYRTEMTQSYDSGGSLDTHLKKEGQMHGMKMIGCHESLGMPVLQCTKDGRDSVFRQPEVAECYFHQISNLECYNFMEEVDNSFRAAAVESQSSDFSHHECLGDQSFVCQSGEDTVGCSLESPTQKPMQRPRDNTCALKTDFTAGSLEVNNGERKQKKRDQNKTAAYRYRQRKRAELDSLEEELHGLEGRNRELRDKAESVEREIQYVKDLLIEVYKARSQRLKEDTSA